MFVHHNPLQDRVAAIDVEIAALEAERRECLGALAVYQRYVSQDASVHDPEEKPSAAHEGEDQRERDTANGTPRPEGIPTIWEMLQIVLNEAPEHTLTGDDIMECIASRWWPGVSRNNILPSAYRFAKQGRLKQMGRGTFALVRESDAAVSEKPEARGATNAPSFLNSNHAAEDNDKEYPNVASRSDN